MQKEVQVHYKKISYYYYNYYMLNSFFLLYVIQSFSEPAPGTVLGDEDAGLQETWAVGSPPPLSILVK